MRLLFTFMLTGLLFLALSGCSEKQKEAARMEQEVKDLEATDDSSPAALDSAVRESLSPESTRTMSEGELTPDADPSAVPPESRPAFETTAPTETASAHPQQEAPKAVMPPAPTGSGYTVQIASCESEDYARHLAGVYTRRGYEPFVATITYNNQVYYRVRVGHFPTVVEARVLRDQLIDRFSIKPWIDRVE